MVMAEPPRREMSTTQGEPVSGMVAEKKDAAAMPV